MAHQFYLLKITLLHTKPEIWRRFVVPASISLDRLHDVIQIVMGWTDTHLHMFTIEKKRYSERPESAQDGLEEEDFPLGDLISKRGQTFGYVYDFGDDWIHELTLEDPDFPEESAGYGVACLDGARACPPEDSGGPLGYEDLLENLKDMDTFDPEDLDDPDDFDEMRYLHYIEHDPDFFLADIANDQLIYYLRWSRDRRLDWGLGRPTA